MWALNALGIDEYADERTIKKAYAKLLKQTRPDENPQGFQELNDAYKAALAWRKSNPLKEQPNLQINTENTELEPIAPQEEHSTPSEDINSLLHKILDDSRPSVPKKGLDHQEAITPAFNINNYYSACMRVVNIGNSELLQSWLEEQTPKQLKDLTTENAKTIVNDLTTTFIGFWQKYNPAITEDCFDKIANFFQFVTYIDTELLTALRTNLHRIWLTTESKEQTSTLSKENNIPFTASNINDYYFSCMEIASGGDTQTLQNWLNSRTPELLTGVSTEEAHMIVSDIAHTFVALWIDNTPPLSNNCFNTITHYFKFDSYINARVLTTISTALHYYWLIQQPNKITEPDWENFPEKSMEEEASFAPYFNYAAFYQQCIEIAQQEDAQTLTYWLNSQTDLWSFEVKNSAGRYLLSELKINVPALHRDCFSAIVDFFGFNDISANIDIQELRALQDQMHSPWVFEASRKNSKHNSHPQDHLLEQKFITQLQKPFSWLQIIFASFPPWRAKRWSISLHKFIAETHYMLPNSVDEKQINYWLDFTRNDRALSLQLILKGLYWGFITPMALFLFTLFIGLGFGSAPKLKTLFMSTFVPLIMLFITFIYIFFSIYLHWQRLPYHQLNKHKYWRLFSITWIPLVCSLSIICYLVLVLPVAILLAIFALFTAFYRVYHPPSRRIKNINSWVVIIVIMFAWQVVRFPTKYSTIELGVFLYFTALLVTMGLWLFDYRKQTSQ